MTAPMVDSRPLTALEHKVVIGFARRMDIAAIADQLGQRQERVGEIVMDLCRLNRQQAAEIARRGRTLPVHVEPSPPPRRPAPKPVTVATEPVKEWPLGDRELHLLKLLATGLPVATIADQQGYKLLTVQTNISRLYRRLGVGGKNARAAALAAGVRRGNLTAAEAAGGEAEMKRTASTKARNAALAKAAASSPDVQEPVPVPVVQPQQRTRKARALQDIQHGTRRGYVAHRRRNEIPCDPCTEANTTVQGNARRDADARKAAIVGDTGHDVDSGAGSAPATTSTPELAVPVKRRRKSDAQWWASLSQAERERAMAWAAP